MLGLIFYLEDGSQQDPPPSEMPRQSRWLKRECSWLAPEMFPIGTPAKVRAISTILCKI
jgi:hypothetical protein